MKLPPMLITWSGWSVLIGLVGQVHLWSDQGQTLDDDEGYPVADVYETVYASRYPHRTRRIA